MTQNNTLYIFLLLLVLLLKNTLKLALQYVFNVVMLLTAIGGGRGPAHFFAKINFDFYFKALIVYYKLVFIEFKNIFNFLDILFFVKSFQYKCIDQNFFKSIFLKIKKNLSPPFIFQAIFFKFSANVSYIKKTLWRKFSN